MGMTHLLLLFLLGFKLFLVFAGEESDPHVVCNATNSARVEYEFSTDVVGSEHIITFKGYFTRTTRENYVTAALNNAGVS